jgi:superfamily II RNA helicase
MSEIQEGNSVKAGKGIFSLDIDDSRLERLQKYLMVFALIVSWYCIGVLFQKLTDLNEKYIGTLIGVIRENSEVMRELKQELKKP